MYKRQVYRQHYCLHVSSSDRTDCDCGSGGGPAFDSSICLSLIHISQPAMIQDGTASSRFMAEQKPTMGVASEMTRPCLLYTSIPGYIQKCTGSVQALRYSGMNNHLVEMLIHDGHDTIHIALFLAGIDVYKRQSPAVEAKRKH